MIVDYHGDCYITLLISYIIYIFKHLQQLKGPAINLKLNLIINYIVYEEIAENYVSRLFVY
jgi:hypothetical protein